MSWFKQTDRFDIKQIIKIFSRNVHLKLNGLPTIAEILFAFSFQYLYVESYVSMDSVESWYWLSSNYILRMLPTVCNMMKLTIKLWEKLSMKRVVHKFVCIAKAKNFHSNTKNTNVKNMTVFNICKRDANI